MIFFLLLFPLVQLFVHLVLKQPDRICISPDELVFTSTFDIRRPLNSLLFTVDKNGHILLPHRLLFGLLGRSEFLFILVHCSDSSFLSAFLSPSAGR